MFAWHDAPKRSPVREITFIQPSHAWLVYFGCKNKAGTKQGLVGRVSRVSRVTSALFKSAVEPFLLRGIVYSTSELFVLTVFG